MKKKKEVKSGCNAGPLKKVLDFGRFFSQVNTPAHYKLNKHRSKKSNLLWPWVLKTSGFSSQSKSKNRKNIPLWKQYRLLSALTRPSVSHSSKYVNVKWVDTKLVSGVIIHIYKTDDGMEWNYCRYCDYKEQLRSLKVISVFVRTWCANGTSDIFLVSSSCHCSCTRWTELWKKEWMGGSPFMLSPNFANAAW